MEQPEGTTSVPAAIPIERDNINVRSAALDLAIQLVKGREYQTSPEGVMNIAEQFDIWLRTPIESK